MALHKTSWLDAVSPKLTPNRFKLKGKFMTQVHIFRFWLASFPGLRIVKSLSHVKPGSLVVSCVCERKTYTIGQQNIAFNCDHYGIGKPWGFFKFLEHFGLQTKTGLYSRETLQGRAFEETVYFLHIGPFTCENVIAWDHDRQFDSEDDFRYLILKYLDWYNRDPGCWMFTFSDGEHAENWDRGRSIHKPVRIYTVTADTSKLPDTCVVLCIRDLMD